MLVTINVSNFVNLVALGSKSNVSRTWNFICSVYNSHRFYINGKLTLEKPIIDEHICIKSGLIRDLIGYSMHEKQDNNVKELIKINNYVQNNYYFNFPHVYYCVYAYRFACIVL